MIKKLLWPEICPFCGKVSAKGICPACLEKINTLLIVQPVCMKCGKPVRKEEQEFCRDCTSVYHYFTRGRAVWLHKPPVSHSVYRFKYHNQREFAKYYALEMFGRYHSIIHTWKPECIIPIPLHRKRKRKRGYNQSMLIAKELSKLTKIPVFEAGLRRKRYTVPQKTLDYKTRRKNLEGAFSVDNRIKGIHNVLLIDDIYTTGNTIDEAARKLKEAGVENVYFLTVSIGQGY